MVRLDRFHAVFGAGPVVEIKSANEQCSKGLDGFMDRIRWLRYIKHRTRGQSKVNDENPCSTTMFTFTSRGN
jgi:hypothetical protein